MLSSLVIIFSKTKQSLHFRLCIKNEGIFEVDLEEGICKQGLDIRVCQYKTKCDLPRRPIYIIHLADVLFSNGAQVQESWARIIVL